MVHHSHQSIFQGEPSIDDQASCLSRTGPESPAWYAEFFGPASSLCRICLQLYDNLHLYYSLHSGSFTSEYLTLDKVFEMCLAR